MKVAPAAGGCRQPWRDDNIVLRKDGRSEVGVGKAWDIGRAVPFPFYRGADDPSLAAGVATRSHFAKEHVVPVAFSVFSELMLVALRGRGHPCREHIAAFEYKQTATT